jgi:hypothetical protein
MKQESVIELLIIGFARAAMIQYHSNYCKLYYSKTGEFEEMLIGNNAPVNQKLDDLTFSLKNTLEIINQAIKDRAIDNNRRFYINIWLDPKEFIKVNFINRAD